MNKIEKQPYLFLIVSIVLLTEVYKPIVNLIGFHITSNHSEVYNIGLLIGMLVRVVFFLSLSVYFFYKFKETAKVQ